MALQPRNYAEVGDYKIKDFTLIPLRCNRVGLDDKVKFFPADDKANSPVRTTCSSNSSTPVCPRSRLLKDERRGESCFLIASFMLCQNFSDYVDLCTKRWSFKGF
ncbi:hypothetical protein AVEN_172010-1 [Araneus ventricosus]|uniref:Uncharacterized protein n=1 Tax=Araneus ventricosus TaxID=182803 RepID=A0A4Y2WJ29_ARAVE|nr:hypothetical protein AVEN_172010-1 [Araneus ventricosus]